MTENIENKGPSFYESLKLGLVFASLSCLPVGLMGFSVWMGWTLMELVRVVLPEGMIGVVDVVAIVVFVALIVLFLLVGSGLLPTLMVYFMERSIDKRPSQILEEKAPRVSDGLVSQAPAVIGSRVPALCRLVLRVVPERSRDFLAGDLEEEYGKEIASQYGRLRARCWWWWQGLGILTRYLWTRTRRALHLEFQRQLED